MTKNDIYAQISENNDKIASLQSKNDILREQLNDPFHTDNLKLGQRFHETTLDEVYIIAKAGVHGYFLANTKNGRYYTDPTPNIGDVFGLSKHKFNKFPNRV